MHSSATAQSQLNEYFQTAGNQFINERVVISEIRLELSARKDRITDKDIILALILRLECENDVVKQDVYRSALEMVVQRTPDDIA